MLFAKMAANPCVRADYASLEMHGIDAAVDTLSLTSLTDTIAKKAPDYVFKLMLLGATGVGKSQLINRFMGGRFSFTHQLTIGVDYFFQDCVILNNKVVRLWITDTAGEERFSRQICRPVLRHQHIIVLAFDVNDMSTFVRVQQDYKAYQEIKDVVAVYTLVGNKIDLQRRDDGGVSYLTAYAFAKHHGMDYVETSARTGDGVTHLFEVACFATAQAYDQDVNRFYNLRPQKNAFPPELVKKKLDCCQIS